MATLTPRMLADLATATFPDDLVAMDLVTLHERRRGLYIYGPTGSGKTLYAVNLLLASIERLRVGGARLYATVPNLLLEARRAMGRGEAGDIEVIERYSRVEWLALDDVAAEKPTAWAYSTLYQVVSTRYEWLRPTIYTSNASLDQLAAHLADDRVPSRIEQSCDVRLMDYKDIRT